MKKMIEFFRKETVLCAAVLLAVISSFIVLPDRRYMDYIDFRTLAILFCLMSVMAGLQSIGVFQWIAERIVIKVINTRQLVCILILLCFFFSMLITNDVSLILFVPFTFTVLKMLPEEKRNALLIPVVVMQTIAANLGSMLTPIGNPQNLYLYGKAELSLSSFLGLMLPYSACSLFLLLLWCMLQGRGKSQAAGDAIAFSDQTSLSGKGRQLTVYLILFCVCLLSVARVLPYAAALVIVFLTIFIMDRRIFGKVDYALLLTFVAFFVFIGNMGRIPAFYQLLLRILNGNEVWISILASQLISNVPAALLLSGFTTNDTALIVGTNLGGLGTLIASMASLISYKYIVREDSGRKGAYFLYFTIANVCFLIILVIEYLFIGY